MGKQVRYVDGYVLVVPKDKTEAYTKMADEAADMWLRHGALSVRECRGDDVTPDMGEYTPQYFTNIMNTKEDEVVWFSYIEYESKESRDRINAAVQEEMTAYQKEHPDHMNDMPFDLKRMAFGGFAATVSKTSE